MDHPFPTRAPEMLRLRSSARMLECMQLMLKAKERDLQCVQRREDAQIGDATLREAVCAWSDKLGRLAEEVNAQKGPALPAALLSEWRAFVCAGKPVAPAFRLAVNACLAETREAERLAAEAEYDTGSSSYSDYSASETESSGDERSSDSTDH
jgi:hypothetical protein